MKRLLLMAFTLFLLLMYVGCGQHNGKYEMNEATSIGAYKEAYNEQELMVEEVVDELVFSSIVDFLAAYRAVRVGSDITDFVADSTSSNYAYLTESVDFLALEKLYMPIGIPEEYQLCKIALNDEGIAFWYLHKADLVFENAFLKATSQQQHFIFGFIRRWDFNSPMDGILRQNGATKEDLIDGKYLFVMPNMFIWSFGRELLYMYTPLPSPDYRIIEPDDNTTKLKWPPDYAYELVKFAEVEVVDLLDEDAVTALIRQYQSASQDLAQDVGAFDDDEIATNDEGGDVEAGGGDE